MSGLQNSNSEAAYFWAAKNLWMNKKMKKQMELFSVQKCDFKPEGLMF